MNNSLKIVALTLCIAFSLPPLYAERRRSVAPPSGGLSIEFVDVPAQAAALIAVGSDAWIDMRTISQQGGSSGTPVRLRRQFGIRILRAGGVSWGTVLVTARRDSPDGRSSVRIDGQPLAGTPIVVDPRATVGSVTLHTLDVEVPASAAEGPLAVSISWEVTAQ